jgi:hypothetical protein
MLRKTLITGLALMACCSAALAEWRDVGYSATLPAQMPYCISIGDLEEMIGYIQDGDDRGLNRMVEKGDCRVSSGMTVNVFQENEYAAAFLAPSGKVFRTLTSFLK